ncbi:MAG TPA: PIG-L family deacetylase, partial [Luteitalea sp.]|nr:PIG-L family deacetylase [Luteitalea sp.]
MNGSRFPRLAAALLASAASLAAQIAVESRARADILVVAPHPDDDIITAAGVIYRARQAGTVVWVAYMTNGDYFASGTTTATQWGVRRANEAVDAQNLLGVPADHLLFLGYPDGSLQGLYGNPAGAFTPPAGIAQSTTTYTRPGSVPYSQIRTGAPVAVNGNNVNADLVHILQTRAPTDIFVVSPDDMHPDHSSTAMFVTDAVAVRRAAAGYNPIVHYGLVWDSTAHPYVWPLAPNATTFFSEPPQLLTKPDILQIGYVWAERESLDVPLAMQLADWAQNLKARAIDAHDTQGGFTGLRDEGQISTFVHKDEFFFPRRITGTARTDRVASSDGPVPNAGLDQTAPVNGGVQLSGSGSLPPSGRSLTYSWRQAEGPAVTLSGATTATPSFTVPASASGATLTFELRVNDGLATSIADAVSVRVSGTVPVDAGTPPPVDAGTPPPVDSGAPPPVDSGTPPVDAGASPQDSGVRLDSGTAVDAGQSLDSGSQDASADAATDSGAAPLDAGSVDAATETDATTGADAAPSSDAAMVDPAVDASARQGVAWRT